MQSRFNKEYSGANGEYREFKVVDFKHGLVWAKKACGKYNSQTKTWTIRVNPESPEYPGLAEVKK